MIPKIIHYCWFGHNELPPLAKKCIASWRAFLPDYEIKEWNEDNFDVNSIPYIAQAYKHQKYAFVSDYARFKILHEYGGIYLDTDVELIKPLNELLSDNKGFAGVEIPGQIALGLGFGAEKNNPIIKLMLDHYEKLNFYNADGSMNLIPSPLLQTQLLKEHGLNEANSLQVIENCFSIFPKDYFNPYNFENGKIEITSNTFSIHHYAGSWVTKRNKSNTRVYQLISRILGEKVAKKIRKMLGKKK